VTGIRDAVPRRLVPLGLGAAAIVAGVLAGTNPRVLDIVLDGPPLLRAALTGIAAVLGAWLVGAALTRMSADEATSPRPFAGMVRGVRLIFLAVAAFAAGSAFLLGHPLPLVVALVIAGVDVVETSFLLLVGGRADRQGQARSGPEA
jgi:hypothetical protein